MDRFDQQLDAAVRKFDAPVCVGLDPHWKWVCAEAPDPVEAVRSFSLRAVEGLIGRVPTIKPQVAFYEALGSRGVAVLEEVVETASDAGLLVILDAKRGDIGSTAEAYAQATLDSDGPTGAHAVTLSPYLGPESMAPFVHRAKVGKGVFVLVRTSNPDSGPWQADTGIAERVAAWITETNQQMVGVGRGPIGAVVGATHRTEASFWRERLPNAWILAPGFGAQGAGVDDIRPLFQSDGGGALIVSARGVLYGPSGIDFDGFANRVSRFVDEVRSAR